jgi:release factor glutamine methyltransferase
MGRGDERMPTIADLLAIARDRLRAAGISEHAREASSLLEAATGSDRAFIIAHPEFEPTPQDQSLFHEYVARRAGREPFHYIIGSKEFHGLEFEVSPAVLIPRPETELLVEQAVSFLSSLPNPRFCEVGVGSGCISLSILSQLPEASGIGLDISAEALAVARRNALRHQVANRLELRLSDLFKSVSSKETFDVVISNPPYIPQDDIPNLEPEVRDFEPRSALSGGGDGLDLIRPIIAGSRHLLAPHGALMLEIGQGQAETVCVILERAEWSGIATYQDLQDIPRVISAIRPD